MSLKLRLIWNIIRGRPAIYRVHFTDTVRLRMMDAQIVDCWFEGIPWMVLSVDEEKAA